MPAISWSSGSRRSSFLSELSMNRPSNSVSSPARLLAPAELVADALDLFQELVDRLVAERGHADALSRLHQLDRAPGQGRPLGQRPGSLGGTLQRTLSFPLNSRLSISFRCRTSSAWPCRPHLRGDRAKQPHRRRVLGGSGSLVVSALRGVAERWRGDYPQDSCTASSKGSGFQTTSSAKRCDEDVGKPDGPAPRVADSGSIEPSFLG